jgi:hypothetical protein
MLTTDIGISLSLAGDADGTSAGVDGMHIRLNSSVHFSATGKGLAQGRPDQMGTTS